MAQLDKIIKVMLDQPGADILLASGSEPQLRLEGSPPHVLINRKLTAPHLRLLLGEIAGESAVPQLEAADGGEFVYTLHGHAVQVHVRAWSSEVEARMRSARKATQGQALARVALAKAVASELRRSPSVPGPGSEARIRASDAAEAEPAHRTDPAPPGAPASFGSLGELEPPSSSRPVVPPPVSSRSGPVATTVPASAPAREGDLPIHALFRALLKSGGSDLHLSTGERPVVRRDGEIALLDDAMPRLKGDAVTDLLRPILPLRQAEELERHRDTDFVYEMPGVARFRGSAFVDRRGVSAVFRVIPLEVPSAEKLGLPPAIQGLAQLRKGLVLVTGPSGSGRTTTLGALVDLVNRTRHDHVVTVESPIELVHASRTSLINQREVGTHADTFPRALRAALREDPDVVLVGALPDAETIALALELAESGHLVLAASSAGTACGALDRLIEAFPPDRLAAARAALAESLRAVVAQTLCKRVGGGRVAAFEVLLASSAVANLVRDGKTFQIPSVMQAARRQGMILLDDALFDLVEKKKIAPREAYARATDKGSLAQALRAGGHDLDFPQGG